MQPINPLSWQSYLECLVTLFGVSIEIFLEVKYILKCGMYVIHMYSVYRLSSQTFFSHVNAGKIRQIEEENENVCY